MTAKIHRYTLYNLPVLSEMVIPELDSPEVFCQPLDSPVIEGLKPVLIRRGPTIGTSDIEKKPWFTANGLEEARLRIGQVGELIIRAGEEIEVRALPDVSEGLIRLYLLGSAMGCILHQRGIIPLHISTVSINGRAWAFTAPSGTGKSTLAARLHRFADCPMVSDDVAALYVIDGRPFVAGGPPVMKVSLEFAELFTEVRTFPIPHPESEKVKVQVNGSFLPGLIPLAGIVVLERDEAGFRGGLQIESVTGSEAFLGAVEAIYRHEMARAMSTPSQTFKKLSKLTEQVCFYRGRLGGWQIDDGSADELGIVACLGDYAGAR